MSGSRARGRSRPPSARDRSPGRIRWESRSRARRAGWIRERFPDAQLKEFAGLEALFAAVREGAVMLAAQGEIPGRRLLHKHPPASIQLRLCVLETRPDHTAIAVRPDAPGLARWIDTFLQERSVFYDAEALSEHVGPWAFRMGDPPP